MRIRGANASGSRQNDLGRDRAPGLRAVRPRAGSHVPRRAVGGIIRLSVGAALIVSAACTHAPMGAPVSSRAPLPSTIVARSELLDVSRQLIAENNRYILPAF